jgi:uncharacterized protein
VGKKIKVVFNTNVWGSIFTKDILGDEFSRAKHAITIYVREEINLEISKVIFYSDIAKVLAKADSNQKEALRAVKAGSIIVKPKVKLNIVKEDPEDNKILECAVTAGADVIVSGDKHLLQLGKFKKTKIQSPREFFDSIT